MCFTLQPPNRSRCKVIKTINLNKIEPSSISLRRRLSSIWLATILFYDTGIKIFNIFKMPKLYNMLNSNYKCTVQGSDNVWESSWKWTYSIQPENIDPFSSFLLCSHHHRVPKFMIWLIGSKISRFVWRIGSKGKIIINYH